MENFAILSELYNKALLLSKASMKCSREDYKERIKEVKNTLDQMKQLSSTIPENLYKKSRRMLDEISDKFCNMCEAYNEW